MKEKKIFIIKNTLNNKTYCTIKQKHVWQSAGAAKNAFIYSPPKDAERYKEDKSRYCRTGSIMYFNDQSLYKIVEINIDDIEFVIGT